MDKDLDLQRMAKLVGEIERLQREFQPMPDDVMDYLSDARFGLAAIVMRTPPAGMADLSAKLRMIADMNCDDDSFDPALPKWLATLHAESLAISQDQFGAPAGVEAAQ